MITSGYRLPPFQSVLGVPSPKRLIRYGAGDVKYRLLVNLCFTRNLDMTITAFLLSCTLSFQKNKFLTGKKNFHEEFFTMTFFWGSSQMISWPIILQRSACFNLKLLKCSKVLSSGHSKEIVIPVIIPGKQTAAAAAIMNSSEIMFMI